MNFPLVHGHRGCRGLRPENTLPAFLHALALGVDVLEMDVVVSADQQVVVAHDPWLAPHLGPDPTGHPLPDLPRARRDFNFHRLPYATIRQARVGEWPNPTFPEQQPVLTYRPLLREVLAATQAAARRLGRPPVGYAVEVKSQPAHDNLYQPAPARFVELVLAELTTAAVVAQTTLLSFDPRVLQAARRVAPALRLCLLVESPSALKAPFAGLGFVPEVLGPQWRLLSGARARTLQAAYPALQLVPWTVNEVADLRRVLGWPVAGITTDYPNRLLALSRS